MRKEVAPLEELTEQDLNLISGGKASWCNDPSRTSHMSFFTYWYYCT